MAIQTKHHNITSAQLRKKLAALLTDAVSNLYEISIILLEQHNRGELDQAMRQGVFKWFPQIARGELSPLAAWSLDGLDARVQAMVGLPIKTQENLVNGEPVTLAVLDKNGQIVPSSKPLYEMSTRDFSMVFGGGKVRSFTAQKPILASLTQTKKAANRSDVALEYRVDERKDEVIVGQLRMRASDLALALSKLGYEVVRRQARAKAA